MLRVSAILLADARVREDKLLVAEQAGACAGVLNASEFRGGCRVELASESGCEHVLFVALLALRAVLRVLVAVQRAVALRVIEAPVEVHGKAKPVAAFVAELIALVDLRAVLQHALVLNQNVPRLALLAHRQVADLAQSEELEHIRLAALAAGGIEC